MSQDITFEMGQPNSAVLLLGELNTLNNLGTPYTLWVELETLDLDRSRDGFRCAVWAGGGPNTLNVELWDDNGPTRKMVELHLSTIRRITIELE